MCVCDITYITGLFPHTPQERKANLPYLGQVYNFGHSTYY